jgi:hypothetical protein
MKKFLTIAAKFTATLNLIVAVCTGKGVDTAIVTFNNCWN